MTIEYKAKCGKILKSPQGLKGHERLCSQCQAIINGQALTVSTQNNKKSSTKKLGNQACEHDWRPLTAEERCRVHPQTGLSMAAMGIDVVCKKCKEVR